MAIAIKPEAASLKVWDDGSIRVGKTRVSLDSVVYEFLKGSTAEHIVECYDSLSLAEVYEAIAFYLRHREEVDAYLAEREAQGETTRDEAERRWPTAEIRARLMRRQAERDAAVHR